MYKTNELRMRLEELTKESEHLGKRIVVEVRVGYGSTGRHR